MISVRHTISKQKGVSLQRNIESFILSKKKIVTFFTGKKRPVYLEKYLDAHKYRRDKNSRLAYFFTGIELLHQARKEDCTHRTYAEWEILGKTQNNTIIAIHIREEKIENDRILFLISIFEKT